jgi:hypothetical protein
LKIVRYSRVDFEELLGSSLLEEVKNLSSGIGAWIAPCD